MAVTVNASTSSGLVWSADLSGAMQFQNDGSTKLTVDSTGAYGQLFQSTVQNTTSGTAIQFTGIPSWVKRLTLSMQGVSTTAASNYVVRIGNTTFTATGYQSVVNYVNPGANSCTGDYDTTGFRLTKDISAGTQFTAICTIVKQNTTGLYVFNFVGNNGVSGAGFFGSGMLNLGSTLDRIQLTTLTAVDTFDAGSINLFYEG